MYLHPHSSLSVKIVFVGAERTGKTSLIKRCIGGSWDPAAPSTQRSQLSFWPIQSSRGPVETLETLQARDLKSKTDGLSFEQMRDKPLDHAVWSNWADVVVFIYSTESMESYLESYKLVKNWVAYHASRKIVPVGYEETNEASISLKVPVLWIGTKMDSMNRGAPVADQVAATARSLPLKWAEVSARTGDNITQVQEWIYESWDGLKQRERDIHQHSMTQLSNIISTKHCKGTPIASISLETFGRCLRSGTLVKITKRGFKQDTPCFLFEKAFVFCKPANKGTFAAKKVLFLNLTLVTDSPRPANDYAFELHVFGKDVASSSSKSGSSALKDSANSSTHTHHLMALGQADKDAWLDILTSSINHFSRDHERTKHYASMRATSMSARPYQRQGRRQIGLPWSLLSSNASSGVPLVVESITNYLNAPSTDVWGTFFLPGSAYEQKLLSERVNRVETDFMRANAAQIAAQSGSNGHPSSLTSSSSSISPALSSSSSPVLGMAPPTSTSPTSFHGVVVPPLSSSPTSSLVGQSVVTLATGNEALAPIRSIDMNGISALSAAEFLLSFLHASPTFIPVGFFTLLLQSLNTADTGSATGTQYLKTAFASLPAHIFKTLARMLFCIQQSVLNSADDTIILKIARYLVPVLVKDCVEIESLNATKLLEVVQSLVRDADFIFSMPTENVLTVPNAGNASPKISSARATASSSTDPVGSPSSLSMLSFGNLTFGGSFGTGSFGAPPSPGGSVEPDFFSMPINAQHSASTSSLPDIADTQSSISSLLRGMNEMAQSAPSLGAIRNSKRSGSFNQIQRTVPMQHLEGIGSFNTDHVTRRISKARSIMAELLDNLKSVEHVIQAPEVEACLQSLVITCNNLSRYKWEKYLEVVEMDMLDEFCHLMEVFWKLIKVKNSSIEKTLKSKATRASLQTMSADLTSIMTQFTTYLNGLKGHDQARPQGDRPKLRNTGTLKDSNGTISVGSPHDGEAQSTTHAIEFGSSEDLDIASLSAKEWWSLVFGQHSLRTLTDKFISELLAVSKTSVPLSTGNSTTSSSSPTGSSSLSNDRDEGSGSQPGTPRGAPHGSYQLELSENEKKVLLQLFDHQQTGFVNLLKFSQFLKAFGSITSCVEAAINLARLPFFYGYLTSLEATRLLETEEPGTYLLCFESNDPSNWCVHWIDAAREHKAMLIDCSPNEFFAKSRSATQQSSSSASMPPSRSPSGALPSPRPSQDGNDTPRDTLSTDSQPNSFKIGSEGSSISGESSFPTGSPEGSNKVHSTSTDLRIQLVSSGDANVLPNKETVVYPSLQALFDAFSQDLKTPLKTSLYSLPYFYGDISESEAMRALKNQPIGTFCIIFSATKPMILDCLFVTIDERIGHIIFHRNTKNTDTSSMQSIGASSLEDSSSGTGISTSESDLFTNLSGNTKDGIGVHVESGECFGSLSDAIKFFEADLKLPFTTKKSSGHVAMGSVHEGSLEKLVAYLYDDVVDLAYITVFLLTYRSFTQPPTLLDALVTQYRHLDTIPNGKPYQMRLVNFFKIWLSDFSWDLITAQDTLAKISAFVQTDVSVKFPSIAKQLVTYISKIPTAKSEIIYSPPVSPLPTPQSYEEPTKVFDYSPDNLAQQLFSFEFEGFSKIQPFELMGNGWMKADKQVRAPNIVRMVAQSNLLTSWIVSEILKESVLKKRAALVEHFIMVADESYKLNNFHSAMVVMSALHDSSIQRLKLTWEKVSKKATQILELVDARMDDEDNFTGYRTAYAQAPPPKLPYVGLIFRDLIHIEDGSPKHLPNGSINFHRCELIAEKLHMVKLCQQDRLSWPKNEDLWHYISTFPKHPDPSSQYQRSLELEPRAGTTSAAVNTSGSSAERRQSRVMVFTAPNTAGTTSASPPAITTTAVPAGDTSSSEDPMTPPPRSPSPSPSTSASTTTPQGSPLSEGKTWANSKKVSPKPPSKASSLSSVMGFMRVKK